MCWCYQEKGLQLSRPKIKNVRRMTRSDTHLLIYFSALWLSVGLLSWAMLHWNKSLGECILVQGRGLGNNRKYKNARDSTLG